MEQGLSQELVLADGIKHNCVFSESKIRNN